MVSRVSDDSAKPTDPPSGTDKAAPTEETATKSTASRRRRKAPSKSKTSAPRKKTSAAALKAEITDLENRLTRADGVTRKSVQSLETIVSALEAGLKKNTASQKGRLTRHVNALTERLDQQSKDMRQAVRSELKAALAEGSLSDLDAALGRASLRLDKAEVSQADAIARVNKHLADIARAIDARMATESQTRRKELDTVTENFTKAIDDARKDVEIRMTAVERDSAQALNQVGDTIEKIHGRLEERRQASNEVVVGKIRELGQKTHEELSTYQAALEKRLAEIEARHLAVGTGAAERVIERTRDDINHQIEQLQKRIVELENKPDPIAMPKMAALPPLPDATVTTSPFSTESRQGVPPATDTPPNPIQTLRDRLTSFRTPEMSDPQNPYATALQVSNDVDEHQDTTARASIVAPPVQFNSVQPPTESTTTHATPVPFTGQDTASGINAPPFQNPPHLVPNSADEFQPAPMPDAVYANPAYAESVNARAGVMARTAQTDSPMARRVADDAPRRRIPLPDFTNRNLRVGLMAATAIIVALLAGRMILGSEDGPNPGLTAQADKPVIVTEPVVNTLPLTNENSSQLSTDPELIAGAEGLVAPTLPQSPTGTSTDPIGNYTETQPVRIDMDALDTLEAAVEAGNPIAQFQMGLAKLDAGQTDEGAALVRQAASANQPAALYRLAKLYEAGEGVPRDDVMARQLIERAARGGNRIAMHDLALYYTEGRGGVELSMPTAKSWFEQAARRGVVDSQFNLAILSESTETGTTPNVEDALFWYSIAARQGDQFAVSRRDAITETLSADQLQTIEDRISAFEPRPIDEEANGIFNNVPWVKTSQAPSRTQVREAQTLLANLGYAVGTPDGLMGARTRKAITEFERANGLAETGRVSGSLINRLANAAGA